MGSGVDQDLGDFKTKEDGMSETVQEKPTYGELWARLQQVLADYDLLSEKWLELNDRMEREEREEIVLITARRATTRSYTTPDELCLFFTTQQDT